MRSFTTKSDIFALIGDRYHNSDYIRCALKKIFEKELGLFIDFTDETSMLNNVNLEGYKMVIIFRDGVIWPDGYPEEANENSGYIISGRPKLISEPSIPFKEANPISWITPEQGAAIKEFVENGGSALFYHNSCYTSSYDENYRDLQGAVTRGHPPTRPFKLEITNKNHPITQNVKDFIVTDEQHYVTYEKEAKYVFLRSVNIDGITYKDFGDSCEAGWAYDYGKGRVCFLAPGHMITVLWNPEYIKLQRNAIRWCLRQL